MYVKSGIVTDESTAQVPVAGALIIVRAIDGSLASLFDVNGNHLDNPLTSDVLGAYSYYVESEGQYTHEYWFGARKRAIETTVVGSLIAAVNPSPENAGKFIAYDANGNPTASSGTGADAGLRTDLSADGGAALVNDAARSSDLASPTGASLLGFQQAGDGAVARTARDKIREAVSVLDFGAVGDGETDDLAAIVAAFASGAKAILFPNTVGGGVYRVSDGFEINGAVRAVFDAGVVIQADADVVETVQIGKTTMFTGSIHSMTVRKAAYNGSIDDIGVAYYNCSDASYYDVSARYFKYPHRAIPGDGQRVAYSSFWKPVAVGGYYGFSQASTGNGFTNELSIIDLRVFSTSDTDTPLYWDGGNHDRFYNPTCEAPVSGAPKQAIYLGGHSNVVISPRTEGSSWTVDDIVLSEDSQRNVVVAFNLYTTVTDNSIHGTNVVISSLSGSKITVAANKSVLKVQRPIAGDGTSAVLTVEDLYPGSGLSYGVNFQMARFGSDSYVFKAFRASDQLLTSSLSTNGTLMVARQVYVQNSGYAFIPVRLGNLRLWVDTTNTVRQKASDPTSAADGVPLATLVSVPASSTAAGAPGQWAADSTYLYVYTGDGSTHSWVRSAAVTW